jgi:hypothetical protein
MHILPDRIRQKLEDAGLNPTATEDEKALWEVERKALMRRVRYGAAAKSGAVVAIAGAVKFFRHPDMPASKLLVTLGIGVVMFAALIGLFLLQSGTEAESQRTRFIRGRRMHRAILEEPDLDSEEESA